MMRPFLIFLLVVFSLQVFGQSLSGSVPSSSNVFFQAGMYRNLQNPKYTLSDQTTPTYVLPGNPISYAFDGSLGFRIIEMDRVYLGVQTINKGDSLFKVFNQKVDINYYAVYVVNRLMVYKNLYFDLGISMTPLTKAVQWNQFGQINLLDDGALKSFGMRRIFGCGTSFPLSEKIRLSIDYRYAQMNTNLEANSDQTLKINSHALGTSLIYCL
jgi:hypothetical protein